MNTESLLKKYIFLNNIKNQFTQNIDFSKTPVAEVVEKTLQSVYTKSSKNVELHDYIFKFYAYNEILASFRNKQNGIISKEDLKLFSDYQNFLNDFSKRIFSFILYACIAEARHSIFFNKTEDDYYDYNYNKKMQKAFVTQTIDEFKTGKKNKLFSSFLMDLKTSSNSPKKYTETIKKYPTLIKLFNEYLDNYHDIPYDLPESFKKSYKTLQKKNDSINEKALMIFKSHFAKNKNEFDQEKLKRFNDFWSFIEDVANTSHDDESGSLQRNIIKKKMIQKSKIKDIPIEEIFEYLSVIFLKGFDDQEGYGGKPWSDIAKHGLSFSKGLINSETFIDQALSLEHNNGQMFNKKFIFEDNFLSHYFNLFLLEDNNSLIVKTTEINIKDFILHLQNSSSVLSLANIPKEWNTLITNLDNKKLKEINPNLNNKHIFHFLENFNGINSFTKNLKFLPEMIALAKKVDYSIPSFDYFKLILVALDKKKSSYLDKFEKSSKINQLFSNIISGNYSSVITDKKIVIEPTFKIHNLNSHSSKNLSKNLIGGKAFGLLDLINKGFNVPKAMVFDTKTCLSYLDNPKYFHKEYKAINKEISEYLIDENKQPILVSVRSGAPVSMPGMMDSILNVGIDDTTYPKLCSIYGKEMINECALSFMHQFCSSKLGLNIKFPKNLNKALDKFTEILIKNDIPCNRKNTFPLDKEDQIKLSVEAVFNSWNSPRAIAWRNEKNISHDMGTAAIVQQMVFGNKNENSLTCVVFSRDCITGKPEIMGEYLVKAQGEDLVSGKRTPLPIKNLAESNPKVYKEIEYIAKVLEEEKKAIQDLEITVENGKVYVLQMRNAVVSPEAQITLAKELDLNLLDIVQPKHLIGETKVNTTEQPNFNGLAASPGLISGIIIKNKEDIEKYKSFGKPLIFFSNQALPEHAPIMIATQAFVTEFGGATSHAAILARSMGKPCIVGIGKQDIDSGEIITMDASNGKIWKGELPIVVNQHNAVELANKILEEEKIQLDETFESNRFNLKSWISDLSNLNILKNTKNTKHNMFLNISQKTALALKMENIKKTKII
jgi:phosphohistidine swiveling domain-containing protein